MKKLSLFVAVCLMSAATSVFGQTPTQSISFDDGNGPGNAGTYSPSDSFSVDLYLAYSGYSSGGFSLWFEATAAAAPFTSLTGFTYGTTFFDPIQPFSSPIGFTLNHGTGFYGTSNPSDFGATINPPYDQTVVPPGTYFVGHLTISLAGLAPGVYILRTDATNPHGSIVTNYAGGGNFIEESIPNAEYTITVVPEPGTLALLSLGAIGLVAASRMRKA